MTTQVSRGSLHKLFIGLLSAIAILFSGLVLAPTPASAATIGNIVISASIVDENGNTVTSGNDNSVRNLKVDFKLPNNTVKAGDTSTITLPDEFRIATGTTFDVVTPDKSAVVAHAVVDSATRTATLTYTDYPETHSEVTGTLQFSVRINAGKLTQDTTFPVIITVDQHAVNAGTYHYTGQVGDNIDEGFAKWGWRDNNDAGKNVIHYSLRVNAVGSTLRSVIVSDALRSAGMSYVQGSFQVEHGVWSYNTGTSYWTLINRDGSNGKTPTFAADAQSFSIDLGDLHGDGYLIRYDVELNYTPVNNEVINNYARMTRDGDTIVGQADDHYTWESASGEANGYQYSLKLKKTNEAGESLSGAVFKVVRDRTGEVVSTVTTDAQGEATVNGLLMDNYTVTETQAPTGYNVADPVHITPQQFNNTVYTADVTVIDTPAPSVPPTTETPKKPTPQPTPKPIPTTLAKTGVDSSVLAASTVVLFLVAAGATILRRRMMRYANRTHLVYDIDIS